MNDEPGHARTLLRGLSRAMHDFEPERVKTLMHTVFAPGAVIHHCHPFGDMSGPEEFYDRVYAGLFDAWPDLERRDYILMAGPTDRGDLWVGSGGFYCGTFLGPWLDIPPTGHLTHMRFHEFHRIVDGKVAEFQAIWDIPEVLMQADAWPMSPSLGREWCVPGPGSNDGIRTGPHDDAASAASCKLVVAMLDHMKRHPALGGPEVMEMPRFWHERMNWYGPAGIGTGRGIEGFRNWHQIPFLNAMPDRGQYVEDITYHFFGDGDYVGVTGWPDMIQTLDAPGWLGIAAPGKRITMRSLDFWRLESGRIRENWVLVDLLDMYSQIGVDVFARLREFNKARVAGRVALKGGVA